MRRSIGTALLILLGDGVVAAVLLTQSKAQNSGWIVITWGWGMAVMFGVFAVGQFSGAHLNPAVTFGFAVIGNTEWSDVPKYLAGEFVGAIIGATLVWLRRTATTGGRPRIRGSSSRCSAPAPAIRNTVANIITEIIGTFVLVFGVLAIFANKVDAAADVRARRAARRPAGARHRPVARRPDGLRDQPGARPRAADHARDPADPGQGRRRTGATRGSRSSAR